MSSEEIVLPSDGDAEIAVLGACLADREALLEAAELLKPEEFFSERRRIIFRTMVKMSSSDQAVDFVTVTAQLRENGLLERAGGAGYVSELENYLPDVTNVAHYARLVADAAKRRRLAVMAHGILQRLEEPVDEVIENAMAELLDVAERRETGPRLIGDVLKEVVDDIVRRSTGQPGAYLFGTGLSDVDDRVVLRLCQLIVIAGLSGTGKTAFGLQIAENAARAGKRGLFFSCEMSDVELSERSLAAATAIPATRLELASLTRLERQRIIEASVGFDDVGLQVMSASGMTMQDIRTRARHQQLKTGLDFVVIDYLQLLAPADRRRTREQEVAEMARQAKDMAMSMRIPVFLIAQLNKDSIREKRRPTLSDIRESAAVGQHADVVIATHRPSESATECELLILKQRQGPVGLISATFDTTRMRFRTLRAMPAAVGGAS